MTKQQLQEKIEELQEYTIPDTAAECRKILKHLEHMPIWAECLEWLEKEITGRLQTLELEKLHAFNR